MTASNPSASARSFFLRVGGHPHMTSLGDDDAADISNDLGFVCAVEDDLKRQLEPGRN